MDYDFVKIGKLVSTKKGPGIVRDIATLSSGRKKALVQVFGARDLLGENIWLDFHQDDIFTKPTELVVWEISNLAETASERALYFSRLLQVIASEKNQDSVPRETFEP
jgi:hypothetical protein